MLIPRLIMLDMAAQRIPGGEVLLEEGTSGTTAFVLEDGEVAIDIKGQEITTVSDHWAIFGEMSVLLDRPRGATVTTVRDSTFYVIEDLAAFLEEHPGMTLQLLKLLAERIDHMNILATDKERWWHII